MSADAAPKTAAKRTRTRWAIAATAILVLLVAGVVGFSLLRPKSPAATATSTATVDRKTIKVLVSGTGTTVVNDSVTVNPEISGTVEKLNVSLGETVTAGDDLYTISGSDVENQLLKAEASLLQSKQSRTQAVQSHEDAEGRVYSARTSQIQAQQNLDKLESQPATAPGQADQIEVAERQLNSAKESVESAEIGEKAADTGVAVADANLKTAQKSYDDALADTKKKTVTAPITGVVTALPISVGTAVTAGSTSSGSASGSSSSGSASGGSAASSSGGSGASSGSSAASSGNAITISDMSSIKVQASVSEVDIPKVAKGQKAAVTFDAIPNRVFAGVVGLISPSGTSSSGVVNYSVDINLDALDPSLRPNMTATADIETKIASDVLVVPSAAIKTDGTTKYVEVVDASGQMARKTVTVGVSDDTYTEVTSGVNQGDSVSTGASTASSSTNSSSRGGGMFGGPPGGGSGGPGGPGGN